jgi:phage FluMu gp28-like protein
LIREAKGTEEASANQQPENGREFSNYISWVPWNLDVVALVHVCVFMNKKDFTGLKAELERTAALQFCGNHQLPNKARQARRQHWRVEVTKIRDLTGLFMA